MSGLTYRGMSYYRRVGVNANDRRRWRAHFLLGGMFHAMTECGDRNDEIEPCPRIRNAKEETDDGLLCYQVSFLLYHGVPPEGKVISHRCRNPISSATTSCCNPNHMFLQPQSANRRNAKCHNAIVKIAYKKFAAIRKRRKQGLRCQSFRGPIFSPRSDCEQKDLHGNGGCFINYGKNKSVSNTARIYVLRL